MNSFHLTYSSPMHHTRVTDNNVQPAKRLYTRIDGSLPVLAFRRVACERHCDFTAERLVERSGHSFAVFRMDFEDQDTSSFCDEFASNAFAESQAGARDDCFFVR